MEITPQTILGYAKDVIIEEAGAISNLAGIIDVSFAGAVNSILQSKGRVVVTGIGKSANIGSKIVATLNSTGTPAMFMHAADAIHGDLGMVCPSDVVLCISKSGNTPEIKVLVPLVTRMGNTLIAMVSDTSSYLAEHASFIIPATVSREACPNNLAPTNSTTAQLVMGDALAVALLRCRKFSSDDFARYHPGGSLGKKMFMRVKDLYSKKNAPAVTTGASIPETIIEISSKRLGAAAVIGSNGAIAGIITDGDLRRMLQKHTDFSELRAADIMGRSPKTIPEDELAINAFCCMEDNNITQLIVTSENRYAGMLHIHDILKEGIM
jgi:arabinose-5-phosphate isomerase